MIKLFNSKFDAQRIQLLVRNELTVSVTLQDLIIFYVRGRLDIVSFECPHRLSDKLLKSSAAVFPGGAGCVYYAFPPQSQVFIST